MIYEEEYNPKRGLMPLKGGKGEDREELTSQRSCRSFDKQKRKSNENVGGPHF
jgi:hypothetical protein